MRLSLLPALLMLVVGCAHSPPAAEQSEEGAVDPKVLAELHAVKPASSEAATVVLYRNKRFGAVFGPATFSGSLFVDDQAVGDLRDDTYNLLELPAGRHSFRVVGTANGLVVPLQTTTVLTLTAGQVQYLELDSEQGFSSVSVQFRNRVAPKLEEIARDCKKGFQLNLAAEAKEQSKKPSTNQL